MKEFIYLKFPSPPDKNMTNRLSSGWAWMADDRRNDGRYWRALDDGGSRDIYDVAENVNFHHFPTGPKTHKVGVSQTVRLRCGEVARKLELPYEEAKTEVTGKAVLGMHLNIEWELVSLMITGGGDFMFKGKTIRIHLTPPNSSMHFKRKIDIKQQQVHFLVWEHAPDDFVVMGFIAASKAYRLAEKNQGHYTIEAWRLGDANNKNAVNIWI